MELCQLDPVYLRDLNSYNKIVNQRNRLLKDMAFQPELSGTLDVWDMQLAGYAKRIIESPAGTMTRPQKRSSLPRTLRLRRFSLKTGFPRFWALQALNQCSRATLHPSIQRLPPKVPVSSYHCTH